MNVDKTQSGPEPDAAADYLDRARTDMVRGSLWTAIAAVVTLPVAFIASILVARSLEPEGLGRLATYAATYSIVNTLSNLGWSEATVQWLASAGARGAQEESTELIRRSAGYHLCISGPVTAVTAFLLLFSSGVTTALGAALVVWATQIVGTSTVALTAGARNATSAQIGLGISTATQLALLTTAAASHDAALTWTVGLGFALLGPAVALGALRPWERGALFRPQLSLRVPDGFVVYALSACAAGLVTALVFGRSEIFVLRAHELVAATGVFVVVTGLASQLTGPLDSLLAPLTPIAAGIYAVDTPRAKRTFARALRVSAALGTAAACVIVPVGVTIIEPLYGARYSAAVLPFLALGLVSCLQTVLGPIGAFAFATRSAAQVLRTNLICLAADAALAISLVPFIGLWGAIVANAVAQLASLCLLTLVVSRKLAVPIRAILADIRLIGVGLTLGAAEALLCATLDGPARVLAVAVIIAGVTCAALIVRRFRSLQFSEDDLALILRGTSNRLVASIAALMKRAGLVRQASADEQL